MRLKRSLKNLINPALKLAIVITLLSGCSSSTQPTYLIENIETDIRNICRNEYNLEIQAKLIGSTLWIYLPVEDLLVPAEKAEKYTEKFAIDYNKTYSANGGLKSEYLIKPVPDREKLQEYKYNKETFEKINNVWKVLRRITFSMSRKENHKPDFFYIVTADTKNGLELNEVFYYLDLTKVSYGFISWNEYQHRSVQDVTINPEAIGDKEGRHVKIREITLKDFVLQQIDYRIRLKFQKPEVERSADIDKEIAKIAVFTVKTYGLKGFGAIELQNLLTRNKIAITEQEIWSKPILK